MYNILTCYRYILIINNKTPHDNLIEKLLSLSLIENPLYYTEVYYITSLDHGDPQLYRRQSTGKP
jgi:hypothetical protein